MWLLKAELQIKISTIQLHKVEFVVCIKVSDEAVFQRKSGIGTSERQQIIIVAAYNIKKKKEIFFKAKQDLTKRLEEAQ